ncbi:MAG: hypothetical protein LM590_14860 [Thermofilum sp.]|nr:hypothetical protein [Thermofilum sp.]
MNNFIMLFVELAKNSLTNWRYWLLTAALLLPAAYAYLFQTPQNTASFVEVAALQMAFTFALLSAACQSVLDAFAALHVEHLPATRTFRLTALNRLAVLVVLTPPLYLYLFIVSRPLGLNMLSWEWHAFVWSSMLTVFGWKLAPFSSAAALALLYHVGVKAHVALLVSLLVLLAGSFKQFAKLLNRMLFAVIFYLANRPVTILNPAPLLLTAIPVIILTALLAPPSLRALGGCLDIRLGPLTLEVSMVWDEAKLAVCPAKLAEPDWWVLITLLALCSSAVTFALLPLCLGGLRYIDGKLWPLFYLRGARLDWFAVNLAFNLACALTLYALSFKIIEAVGLGTLKGLLHAVSIALPLVVVIAPSPEEGELNDLYAALIPISVALFFFVNARSLDPLLEIDGRLVLLASSLVSLAIYAAWFKLRVWLEGWEHAPA